MGDLLKLGIAGMGNAGRAVLRDLSAVSGVALTAVADVQGKALESFRLNPAVKTFVTVEAMCRTADIDALWIATPNEFHAEHTLAAAASGKHVVCEKPMAVSLEECDRMIEAAEANNIRLLMHSKAGDPPVEKMRELAAGGTLGRVIQISSWNYKSWLDLPRPSSELDTAKGGGVVFRQGAHQIDIVRAIGGGIVKSVRAATGKWHARFDTEGNYTAFLEFADGTPATLVFDGYGRFDMAEVTWGIGESGFARAASENAAEALCPRTPMERSARSQRRREGARKQPFFGLTLVSLEKGDLRQSPDGVYIYTDQGREEIPCTPFLDRAGELIRLYEAITQKRPIFADGRWGKATLEVVLAILQSSREKREIELKHQAAAKYLR
jgi:phthalate 4,5-cis-dihydrodiol dehydrogenase